MAQHDYDIANDTGSNVRADINAMAQAIRTLNSGGSAPTPFPNLLWADTTNNVIKRRDNLNTKWIVQGPLADTFVRSRSSDTVLGVDDVGRVIRATGSFTQTFTAAATLGDGWVVDYRNDGSGIITLDPNSGETIDGATTLQLFPGESCRIWCNGSAFYTFGLQRAGVKIITLTRDLAAASGNVSYTGVGFRPRAITFYANVSGTIAWSIGALDASVQFALIGQHGVLAGSVQSSGSAVIGLIVNSTDSQTAAVASLDNDGFTLSWTKNNNPTGTAGIYAKCIR